jgi:hypothetical protein
MKIGSWVQDDPTPKYPQHQHFPTYHSKPRFSTQSSTTLNKRFDYIEIRNYASLTEEAIKKLKSEDMLRQYLLETNSQYMPIQEKMVRDVVVGKG